MDAMSGDGPRRRGRGKVFEMKRPYARIITVFALTGTLLFVLGGVTRADLTPDSGDVTFTPNVGEHCNGVIPPGNHTNTEKTIIGGDFTPGGEVQYRLSYPVDPTSKKKKKTWVVTDCVLMSLDKDGNLLTGKALDNLRKWEMLLKGEFTGVPNGSTFTFTYTVDIPADIPDGTQICNVAKTTAAPSAPPRSNRKAGVCFTVETTEVLGTASAAVDVGPCKFANGKSRTDVGVSVAGEATLTIKDSGGDTVESFADDGSVTVGPGNYTWTVEPAEDVTLIGADSGSFKAKECKPDEPGEPGTEVDDEVEVLGERLAKTGTLHEESLYGGFGFFALGLLMVGISKRRMRALE